MFVRLRFLSNFYITTTNIYFILLITLFVCLFQSQIFNFHFALCLTTSINYNYFQVLAYQLISPIDVDVPSSVTL